MTAAMRAATYALCALLTAAAAPAQPAFDVDDFVPPGDGVMFVSRIITGFVFNPADGYRPVEQDAYFVHLVNNFYWLNFQFDYKRSEARGVEESGDVEVRTCRCSTPGYFPTPPPRDATPAAPLPGSKDTMQFAWYRRQSTGVGRPPVSLRSRVTYTVQSIDTTVTSSGNPEEAEKRSGGEQSYGLDTDLFFTIRGRRMFGSLAATRTIRHGTTDDRAQTAIAYTARFPITRWRKVLLRPTLTVGAVSGRGRDGLSLVNPAIEAFWHDPRSKANVHLIWSPQTSRNGVQSWRTEHQIALVLDRAIFAKVFGSW